MIANEAEMSGWKGKQLCFEEKKNDLSSGNFNLVFISVERQPTNQPGYVRTPSKPCWRKDL